jgi:hypothetical protein
VKERCQRYRVELYLPPSLLPSINNPYSLHSNASNTSADNQIGSNPNFLRSSTSSTVPSHGNVEEYVNMIADLQQALQDAEQEIDDLEIELMELVKSRDKTPAAILFFTLMNDPSYIPNLQQLVLQFNHLKQFMNYTAHMDYLTLRKRLQVCLVLMPSIEKLVEKYGLMYQSWSHVRLNWFAERKLRGGSADALTYCPLCYHNLEEKHQADNAAHKSIGGPQANTITAGSRGSQQLKQVKDEKRRVKNQRKTLIQAATNTVSLPALPPRSAPINLSAPNTPITGRRTPADIAAKAATISLQVSRNPY